MLTANNAQVLDIATYDKDMTLVEHLDELRTRLIKSCLAVFMGVAISFYYMDAIMGVLTAPAGKLYYMRPAEAVLLYCKIVLLAGLVFAAPYILWQLYAFVRPALLASERRLVVAVLPLSMLLFIGGSIFAYYFIFPRGLEFFLGFAAGKVSALISMESYLDFLLLFTLPFGLVSNIPLLIFALVYLQLVEVKTLAHYRRHVILTAFIVAAIITPTPDIITQSIMAVPMVLLYELSILICKFFPSKAN